VPLYRVQADGSSEPLDLDVGNPTSMALGPDGALYISSRFEGHVYRLGPDRQVEVYATDLGVPTGLAFDAEGRLFVGDRSGSILTVTPDRHVETFATLPASVAAFHLAFGPDGCLYVTAPTLSTHDAVYRVSPDRLVDVVYDGFGRPQGLAFDASGALYVTEALAGAAGLYRLDISGSDAVPELVVAAPALIGMAFDPRGGLVLASSDTVWRLDADLRPFTRAA
jgi:sugar lactone lactonase YvrE